MATLRLATSPGLRAATTSPLTSQLWSSAAAVNASTTSATTTIPSATVASVAAATASSTVTTTKTIIPPPPSVLAHARTKHVEPQNRYFNPSNATLSTTGGRPGKEPGDENNANLGKTLRILQDHLPRVLQAPLPQEILAPNISLHLFPTTHPHLPTVSGRVAYTAALWTSPIAWNRMPLVGNVRLSIVSERVTKQPLHFAPLHPGAVPEQLVVRWCASGKKSGGGVGGAAGSPSSGAATSEGGGAKTEDGGDNAFTGLFVFQFDAEGRILSHTIETVQEGGDWEKGVGAKVVGLTDWLLGGMRRQGENPSPAFEALDKGKQ